MGVLSLSAPISMSKDQWFLSLIHLVKSPKSQTSGLDLAFSSKTLITFCKNIFLFDLTQFLKFSTKSSSWIFFSAANCKLIKQLSMKLKNSAFVIFLSSSMSISLKEYSMAFYGLLYNLLISSLNFDAFSFASLFLLTSKRKNCSRIKVFDTTTLPIEGCGF